MLKLNAGSHAIYTTPPVMEPNHSIKSSLIYDGTSLKGEQAVKVWQIYQEFLKQLAATSEPGLEFEFELRMTVSISPLAEPVLEHPPLPASPPPEPADDDVEPSCDICGDLPEWVEMDEERGICQNCADHLDEGITYYTEEFAHASVYGKDAVHLLVLRQRADNCRDTIAAAAASYDGYLELHEASVQEKLLNKHAAECLARLPASFAPWWKDTWTHEKWCEMGQARDEVGWPVEKGAPIVQRIAAMFLKQHHELYELKKAHAEELQVLEKRLNGEMEAVMKHKLKEMEAKHAAVLANIERARTEDMKAMEERYQKQQRQDNAKYAECLAPLIDVREKMAAECEKKCHDADRKGYAMGYAFADQKWNPVYKAVCEELAAARKEGANHQDAYIRLFGERDELLLAQADLRQELDEMAGANEKLEAQVEELRMELASAKGNLEGTEEGYSLAFISNTQVVEGLRKELTSTKAELFRAQDSAEVLKGEVDAATKLFQAMRSDLERLNAENKGLREQIEEDKQMVQRHLKEVDKEHAKMMAWEKERLQEENKELQKRHAGLLQLVNPTIKLMKSNPELFGGEALGTSRPLPPTVVCPPPIKEEDKERALTLLKGLVAPPQLCGLVESPSTQGMCMALTKAQYEEMFGDELPPPIVPDEPKVCGTAGCIECPAVEPVAVAEPVPATTHVSCVGCGKPKPNYNHSNWPSPITKRFAKHLAKHSGLRSPWQSDDPKSIRTHEDALEYIAKRVNISVENLLQWTMKHYQSFYDPWTLVEGPHKFNMGTAPATWWC